jgi:propanol-preferring alcohol dehydrogenase
MKAVVVEKPNKVIIKEVEKPKIENDKVLVRILASGICGSDLHIIEGKSDRVNFPLIIGHEPAGIVIETNEENISLLNKNVILYPFIGCYRCVYCEKGYYHACKSSKAIGFELNGSHAEFISIPFKNLIPTSLDPVKAAPLACAGLTVYSAFKNYAANFLTKEDYALIVGVGGLGHIAIQLVKRLTPNIIAIDKNEEKLLFAKKLEAKHVFTNEVSIDELISIADERIKLAFDFVGTNATLKLCYDSLSYEGRLVLIGAGGGSFIYQGPDFKRRNITSSVVGSITELEDIIRLVERDEIKIYTESFPLEKINEAINLVRIGSILGRAVLVIGDI